MPRKAKNPATAPCDFADAELDSPAELDDDVDAMLTMAREQAGGRGSRCLSSDELAFD